MTLHRLRWPAIVVALAAGLGVYAAFVLAHPGQVYFGGDQARLFDQASGVLHGRIVLTGPYSKGDRFHPGPSYFYLLAAAYAAAGGNLALATAITSALKSGALVALSLLTYRLYGSLALAAAAPFSIAFGYWFLWYLKIEWNPAIVLPFLAFAAWAAVESTAGSLFALAGCGLALSVAAQSHLALVPVAAAMGGVTLVAWLAGRHDRKWTAIRTAALACAVLWMPVAVDALMHRGGNLLQLVRDLGATSNPHSFAEVFAVVGQLVGDTLPFSAGADRSLLVAAWALFAAGALWWRGRWPALAWYFAIVASSWVAFVWSISRIPNQIETYYLEHVTILTALVLIGGSGVLVTAIGTTPRRRELAGGFMAVLCLVGAAPAARQAWTTFSGGGWNDFPLSDQEILVRAIDVREPSGRPIPIDYYPALNGFRPSFEFLLRSYGHEPREPLGIGCYRVLARSAYEQLGGRPVDGGRELFKNASYVLEYIPNR